MATYADVRTLALVAGHPGLDLVNTVEPRAGNDARHEHLRTPADLLVWAQRASLVESCEAAAESEAWEGRPLLAADVLDRVVAIREALYAVATATAAAAPAVPVEQFALLRQNWAVAAERAELRRVEAGSAPYELVFGADPGLIVLDRVARSAIDVLTNVDLAAMRTCPEDEGGCGWLFLDRSRGGSRRWCVMADCGAKAKARRLTERRREARRRS